MASAKVTSEHSPASWAYYVAKKIRKDISRVLALAFVGELIANQGKPKNALKMLTQAIEDFPKIKKDASKIAACVGIVKRLNLIHEKKKAKALLDEGFTVARAIPGDLMRAQALKQMVVGYVETGYLDEAKEVLELIQANQFDPSLFSDSFGNAVASLARGYVENRQEDEAFWLVEKVESIFDEDKLLQKTIGIDYIKDKIFSQIARGYLSTGQEKEALASGEKIQDTPERMAIFLEIAEKLEAINKKKSVASALRQAWEATLQMEDVLLKAKLLKSIGIFFHRIREKREATEALNQAYEVAEKLQNVLNTVDITAEIAEGYFQIGESQTAHDILENATQQIQKIKAKYSQAIAYAVVGEKFAKMNERDEAKRFLLEGYQVCLDEPKKSSQAFGLGNISLRLQAIGEEELFIEILNQALDTSREISKEATRWRLLQEMADKYSKIKEFQIAFMIAEEIRDADWQSWVVLEILKDYSETGANLYDRELVFLKSMLK